MLNLNIDDSRKIKSFLERCECEVGEKPLVTCILHGSAIRHYGFHNDLDLAVFCDEPNAKSRLELTCKSEGYLDTQFISVNYFLESCQKPFSDSYGRAIGAKIRLAGDKFRLSIILSIIHGVPVYKEEKGIELLKHAREYLEAYYGTRYEEICNKYYKDLHKDLDPG